MCTVFEIQVGRASDKNCRGILKSNLRQQCLNEIFAEDSILYSNKRFVIYLGIFPSINHCIVKNQATFLSPLFSFLAVVTRPQET